MDIDGLGPVIVDKLIANKLIENASDIYSLKHDDIISLENFKEKSTENLLRAIENSKKQPLSRLLFGLGIRFVGEHTAQVLEKNFKDLDEVSAAKLDELSSIFEIGPRIAQSIITFFDQSQNREIIEKLRTYGINFKSKTGPKNLKESINNKTFVLTGKLETLNRNEAKSLIELSGGRVASSVSKNTDYVVSGLDPGSKYSDAVKLKVKIISEEEFKNLLSS